MLHQLLFPTAKHTRPLLHQTLAPSIRIDPCSAIDMAPSDKKSPPPAAAHRYQLRQRRNTSRELSNLQPATSASDNDHSDTNADDDDDGVGAGKQEQKMSLSESLVIGLSPRFGENFPDNMFRAARGSDLENLLLFREQPRQFAVLALVVAAVSYFSFTHDSQVGVVLIVDCCYGGRGKEREALQWWVSELVFCG